MRAPRLVALAAVALASVPACSRGGGDDDSFQLELDGRAEIVAVDGDRREVDDGDHRVAFGDTIDMLEGTGELALPGDRALLLRGGGSDATSVLVGATPEVLAGDAVVVAGEAVDVSVGDVDVALERGAARLQRGISVTVGVYEGVADIRAAGRTFDGGLRALRQLSVPATGVLPREAVPIVYDEDNPDAWDLRFLGDAIDLGDELDRQSRGFTGQLGPGARGDASLLRRVLPDLDFDGLDDVLSGGRTRTPGESLVGAAIVLESGAPTTARWNEVFTFREAGAQWGLVAFDQAVARGALLDAIRGAFGRSPLLFAAGPGSSGGTPTTSPTTAPPTSPTTSTTQPDDGDDPDEPEPPVTIPPVTIPPITVPPLLDEPLVDPLTEVIDEVLGGLVSGSDTGD
jgi:hypothetical protein